MATMKVFNTSDANSDIYELTIGDEGVPAVGDTITIVTRDADPGETFVTRFDGSMALVVDKRTFNYYPDGRCEVTLDCRGGVLKSAAEKSTAAKDIADAFE